MLSKGGKIEYTCPHCASPDIRHRKEVKETFALLLNPVLLQFNSGWCDNCNELFYWAARIKRSLKKRKEK